MVQLTYIKQSLVDREGTYQHPGFAVNLSSIVPSVLDYIMEIGMLVKIRQAELIDDDMFSRVKCDVSRRYGIYPTAVE